MAGDSEKTAEGLQSGTMDKVTAFRIQVEELLRSRMVIKGRLQALEESLLESRRRHSFFAGVTIYLAPTIHTMNTLSQQVASITLQGLLMEAEMLGANSVDTVGYTTSHVITYRQPSQVLDENLIMRSLGGRDVEELITLSPFWNPKGRSIKVLYHEWLEDSLAARELMAVDKYVAVNYVGHL